MNGEICFFLLRAGSVFMKSLSSAVWLVIFLALGSLQAMQEHVPESVTFEDVYPYSEIGKIYDTVLESMVPGYFKKRPELANEHQPKLKEFVLSTLPREEFVKSMIKSSRNEELFQKAAADESFRATEEFQTEFGILVRVSVDMAMIDIAARFDVYNRKNLEPSETTQWLFSMANSMETEEYISWSGSEVSVEDARGQLGEGEDCRDGDRFFAFWSPDWYWKKMAGRAGLIQVRDGKIIKVHITMLN